MEVNPCPLDAMAVGKYKSLFFLSSVTQVFSFAFTSRTIKTPTCRYSRGVGRSDDHGLAIRDVLLIVPYLNRVVRILAASRVAEFRGVVGL